MAVLLVLAALILAFALFGGFIFSPWVFLLIVVVVILLAAGGGRW